MNTESPEAGSAPKIEADPVLDRIVDEIDDCIAGMIGYSMDDDPGKPNYHRMVARKRELEATHEKELLPYLKPYLGIKLESRNVSSIEWNRYRVARNWGKYEGNS